MNVNHLDARAITQPGGMYASANEGILEALKAYFQFKDRQAQGERELKRDERTNRRAQRFDAISLAKEVGARPGPEASGWLDPADQGAIDSVLAERAKRLAQADTDRSRNDAMGQLALRARRLELAKAGALLPDSGDLLGDQDAVESAAAEQGAEQRRLQIDALRKSLLPKPVPQIPERSGWAPFRAKDGTPMLYDRQSGAVKPAVPGADLMNSSRGAPASAGGPARVSIPQSDSQPAQPSVNVGGVDLTPPSAQHDPQRVVRALYDHAGIDGSGSFAPLLPDLIGADPERRVAALRQMPAAWRLRTIDALRRAGITE